MVLSASFSEVHSFGAGAAVWFRRIEVEPLPVHYREGQGAAGTSMAYDICR